MFGVLVSCPPAEAPPIRLLRGGKVTWETLTFWDRNGDGKVDRIRRYQGSGYAREYFDEDFDGRWDFMEHAPNGQMAIGLAEKRIPLSAFDQQEIKEALSHVTLHP